jgi:hypothetical protein
LRQEVFSRTYALSIISIPPKFYRLTPLVWFRLVSTPLSSNEHVLAPARAKRRAGTGDNTTAKQKEKYHESE